MTEILMPSYMFGYYKFGEKIFILREILQQICKQLYS